MQNLINFFVKYHLTFLFVFLQLIGFSLLVSYNKFHNVSFLSWTGEVSGTLYSAVNNFSQYVELKEKNDELAEENARLRSLLKESYLSQRAEFNPFTDTLFQNQFTYTEARAINSTVDVSDNFFTLNKGSKQGVEQEMGVLGASGVVGIVTSVSDNFSVVMPLIHSDFQLSSRLKSSSYFGILKWEPNNDEVAYLHDIPNHVQLFIGDTILTKGASGIFPPDQLVGVIESWESNPGSDFYMIKVRLSTIFRRTDHVYVIKNVFQKELIELEKGEGQ